MIETELRAQMLACTAHDTPSPDLLRRVHAGVRRSQSRRRAVVGGIAVAVSVTSVAVAVGGVGGAPQRPDVALQGPAAPQGEAVGPTDAQLRAAEWFSYESQPEQPGMDRGRERRWAHRDGRHVAQQPDGSLEVYATDSRFPIGEGGASWDELLALPADAGELERRMVTATGGRPDDERVLDQVAQLLARSPALLPVRRALLEAAVAQDGVTLVEDRQDSLGRPALLLEHTDRDGAELQLWVDPGGYRLLEQRLVAGPDFPTPPTDGPVPPDGPGSQDAPEYAEGDLLYAEVFLSWSTTGPPTR